MKRILLLVLAAISLNGFSQNATDRVIDKSCSCLTKEDAIVENYDEFMALVVKCVSPELIESYDELKKELGITESDLAIGLEQVGRKIGEQLVFKCPKFSEMTMKMLGEDQEFKDLATEELAKRRGKTEQMAEEGTVSSVENSFPCQLVIKTDNGETLNVLWLDNISMDAAFVSNPQKLKGKHVKFVYGIKSFYDPKLGKYVSKKVLAELNL